MSKENPLTETKGKEWREFWIDPDFGQYMECDKARDMIIYLVRELREEPGHEE